MTITPGDITVVETVAAERLISVFAENAKTVDNGSGVVSAIGELSAKSQTYSKLRTQVTVASATDISIHVFHSITDGVQVNLSPTETAIVRSVVETAYDLMEQGSFGDDFDAFSASVMSQLSAIGNFDPYIERTSVQTMVERNGKYCPSSIEFTADVEGRVCYFRIWFSDASFASEYDRTELVIVPPVPVENIDLFLQGGEEFDAFVDMPAFDAALDITQRTAEAVGVYPATVQVPYKLQAYPTAQNLSTAWVMVYYGPGKRDNDSVQQAIIEFLETNSSYPIDSWKVVFPDLFADSEYIVIPFWNNYAIPNQVRSTGLYGQSVTLSECKQHIAEYAMGVGYTPEFGEANSCVMPTTYRNLSTQFVGSPFMRDGIRLIRDRYPDYLPLKSTDPEAQRMSARTREFAQFITELLQVAETATGWQIPPGGKWGIVNRSGITYVSGVLDDITYLAVTKNSTLPDL